MNKNINNLFDDSIQIWGNKLNKGKRYRIIADGTATCKKCWDMDGEVFDMAEASAGYNMPPFHPNCKCKIEMIDEGFESNSRQTEKQPSNYTPANVLSMSKPIIYSSEYIANDIANGNLWKYVPAGTAQQIEKNAQDGYNKHLKDIEEMCKQVEDFYKAIGTMPWPAKATVKTGTAPTDSSYDKAVKLVKEIESGSYKTKVFSGKFNDYMKKGKMNNLLSIIENDYIPIPELSNELGWELLDLCVEKNNIAMWTKFAVNIIYTNKPNDISWRNALKSNPVVTLAAFMTGIEIHGDDLLINRAQEESYNNNFNKINDGYMKMRENLSKEKTAAAGTLTDYDYSTFILMTDIKNEPGLRLTKGQYADLTQINAYKGINNSFIAGESYQVNGASDAFQRTVLFAYDGERSADGTAINGSCSKTDGINKWGYKVYSDSSTGLRMVEVDKKPLVCVAVPQSYGEIGDIIRIKTDTGFIDAVIGDAKGGASYYHSAGSREDIPNSDGSPVSVVEFIYDNDYWGQGKLIFNNKGNGIKGFSSPEVSSVYEPFKCNAILEIANLGSIKPVGGKTDHYKYGDNITLK